MNTRDPFVEDFVWSMNDSRHTESASKELTETDVPRLMLYAETGPAKLLKLQDATPPRQLTTVPRRTSRTDKACVRMSLARPMSLMSTDRSAPSRIEDVAPHRESDIAHHDVF